MIKIRKGTEKKRYEGENNDTLQSAYNIIIYNSTSDGYAMQQKYNI
jgi:hypothetical protein